MTFLSDFWKTDPLRSAINSGIKTENYKRIEFKETPVTVNSHFELQRNGKDQI